MNNTWSWDKMIKFIEELEKSLDTTHYLTSSDWEKEAKKLNL